MKNEVRDLWLSDQCAHGSGAVGKSCRMCPAKIEGKQTVTFCKCRCHGKGVVKIDTSGFWNFVKRFVRSAFGVGEPAVENK